MKTAISNIAWNLPDDERVAGWMKEHGVGGVEIAPTKIWPKPLDATVDQLPEGARGNPVRPRRGHRTQPARGSFGAGRHRRPAIAAVGEVVRASRRRTFASFHTQSAAWPTSGRVRRSPFLVWCNTMREPGRSTTPQAPAGGMAGSFQ